MVGNDFSPVGELQFVAVSGGVDAPQTGVGHEGIDVQQPQRQVVLAAERRHTPWHADEGQDVRAVGGIGADGEDRVRHTGDGLTERADEAIDGLARRSSEQRD